VGSGVATVGQHYSAMYLGWGFWPKWEVDISTTLFEKEDGDETNHFSTSAYVKRLLYENETQEKQKGQVSTFNKKQLMG
jgi:hypothetical protein